MSIPSNRTAVIREEPDLAVMVKAAVFLTAITLSVAVVLTKAVILLPVVAF
jgi:hypothetical protein